jgi:hypothetical protein
MPSNGNFFSLLNIPENREDTERLLREHAAVRAEGDKIVNIEDCETVEGT